jgi:hypothetical protein
MIAIDSTIVTSPVTDRRNEPGGIDGQKLDVVPDTGQQVNRPQPVGEAHFLQQPNDPKSPALAEDGDHVRCSFVRSGYRHSIERERPISYFSSA